MSLFRRIRNWFRPALPAKHIAIDSLASEEAIHAFIVREAFIHGVVAYQVAENGSLTRIDTEKDQTP